MNHKHLEQKIDGIPVMLTQHNNEELENVNNCLKIIMNSRGVDMHYLGRSLGIREEENGFKMELGLQNENTYGVAQGGEIYTLAVVAIGYNFLQRISKGRVFTQELKLNFVAKGKGKIYTRNRIYFIWGNRTVVGDCSIKDDHDHLVAQALGTFYITV